MRERERDTFEDESHYGRTAEALGVTHGELMAWHTVQEAASRYTLALAR